MTERPYGVPRFAMLDIWMSLGGDSQDFEDWANDPNRFPADAWAQLCAAVASNVDALEADTNPPAGDTLLALAKRRAEIDALRSELEAMRPVVEAACDLMAPFQWTTAGMNRLREAVGAYRDSRPERLCVAEGHMTVGPEGAFHDPDEGPCEWADSSRSVRNGE